MILDVLRECENGASLPALRDALGLNGHMIAQLVLELVDAGFLEEPASKVPCCQSGLEARYRLTETGRAFLARMIDLER